MNIKAGDVVLVPLKVSHTNIATCTCEILAPEGVERIRVPYELIRQVDKINLSIGERVVYQGLSGSVRAIAGEQAWFKPDTEWSMETVSINDLVRE